MNNAILLHILTAVHTLLFALTFASLFYIFWAAWKRRNPRNDWLLLVCLVWPWVDLVFLLANGMECPLQSVAKELTGQRTGWVRDIYWLPESWIRHIPNIHGIVYWIGTILVFVRMRRA